MNVNKITELDESAGTLAHTVSNKMGYSICQ